MLLTAILLVIVLALIYHFVTEKKQILEEKETRVQPMAAIPEKKTPEEIIKESEELQLKADKKQVGKTKKKTKSKKSKKAIKNIPKGTNISKEKKETDKKVEMAESSPETIPAVAATRNVIPQMVSNVATEKKAAERIGKEESRKEKKKSKKKSKSNKSKKGETEVTVKQQMNKQTHQTEKAVMKAPATTEIIAAVSDETGIVQQIKPDEFITEVQKIEKKDSKKSKKRSKKRSKSKKSKKTEENTVDKEAASSQMPKADITSPKLTFASEHTALEADQPNVVPPISVEEVEKPVIKDERKGEKKDSKKIKKKSKKRTKSKKSKKTVENTVDKEAASSQMPKADITSPKLTFASEHTALEADQPNVVPPISVEEVEKPVIKDERKGEKKDSKKIKKKSKKRTKSKKSKKTVENTVDKEAASSQMPKADITSPKLTFASEHTALEADQPNVVPPISVEEVEKPVIKDERKGEKKDSKKSKKKSKKRTKSKKSKKTVENTVDKEAASSQMPKADITSLKLTFASEHTALEADQPNVVPPIFVEEVEKPVIKDERKGEKKDSKKSKKKSKKRTKSKKSKKPVEDKVAK